MTMSLERTRSVIQTRDFRVEFSLEISLPELMRRDAEYLLCHYPTRRDMVTAACIEEHTNSLAELFGSVFNSPIDEYSRDRAYYCPSPRYPI
ncbi:BPSL0761 family protein [Pseudomonas bubulae]|uniref:BPSL0761 family protein n=2 Tax=Pseudomonas TaxID=286 RepID=UPI0009E34EA5